MSFIYPRTISVRRPSAPSGRGAVGYQGLQASDESVIASGLAASIQESGTASRTDAGLPADAFSSTIWRIFIPQLPDGQLRNRDIIVDDQGRRFQVVAAYWNSLGYNARCHIMET
ncbi:hypothetical protein GCM10007036_14370 [Alsobacter metallidurans]|uniref:Uncharacterized protein n=1 Tax=Alsobacter metallidurans TaxID=340221 RepID=A0A917I684_9HYPH|nr:hypothetical protein [Alsobacter metallidurans]GGH14813.1 hypothetical protein GCM10007036_14370 [Alsobacter metallidurans]